VPTGCGGNYFVRVGFPAEWLWVGVVVCDVSVNGGLQIDNAEEGSTFEAPYGQRREESLHRIQP
jgi:hypothetical protein